MDSKMHGTVILHTEQAGDEATLNATYASEYVRQGSLFLTVHENTKQAYAKKYVFGGKKLKSLYIATVNTQ